jgi:putative ABC transport system ATP-binding protein/lipoprotein-releasing system ATP-binding protein
VIIECKNLIKTYLVDGRRMLAVDEVSFVARQGEFIFIHGHSGSGKTTLLSLIGGLTSPESGQVLIDGQDNWQQSDNALSDMRNRTIGFIFQFASLIPALSVLENVLLPMSFGGVASGARERAEQLLVQVGLKEKIHSYPGQLSGGQQRRVAIARAFINQPAIILADEPTGDLDEDTEQEIFELFKAFNREQQTTFLIVTHNQHLATTIPASRVFTMRQGLLTESQGN